MKTTNLSPLVIHLLQAMLAIMLLFAVMGSCKAQTSLKLTPEEQAWLAEHPVIKVGSMLAWEPISFVAEMPKGISIDYFERVNEQLGGRLILEPDHWAVLMNKIKTHQIDVLMDVSPLASRSADMLFTSPYLTIPHVIIAQKGAELFRKPEDLNNKVIALEKGFGNVEYFKRQYPKVLIHEYLSTAAALEAVSSGLADAYVGNRAVAIYVMQNKVMQNLKVHSVISGTQSILAMGVRSDWPILQSILQKALHNITPQQQRKIYEKWIDNELENAFRLRVALPYLAGLLALLSIFLFWSLYLKKKLGSVRKTLHTQMYFDRVTGLANRYLFQDRLGSALNQAKRQNGHVWVLACQLNGLSQVHKLQGSAQVEAVLMMVSQSLTEVLRDVDTIGRWSDDVFLLSISGLENVTEIEVVMGRLQWALANNTQLKPYSANVSFSWGGCVFPDDAQDLEELIYQSLLTAEEAGQKGRNAYVFYSPGIHEAVTRRVALNQGLVGAIERGEIQVYFQPKIRIATGKICSFEALVRWFHPNFGSVSPEEFIPIAEENEQILALGEYVFQVAITEAQQWILDFPEMSLSLALNLSPVQLKSADILAFIESQLTRINFDKGRLEIEITEGILLAEKTLGASKLFDLKALGLKLSMDDFGKGYSSLSYLRRYPFDVIKIDKEFIDDLDTNQSNQQLVLSIIALAKTMNLEVVAEGVETQAQLDFLKRHGCDIAQGFYFSPAVDAQTARQFLTKDTLLPPTL
ncbi:EAL domain-containing protein [Thiosulfativibrio zosterae]|uniref:Diguanylate cyclase n=1 Tax=Thiosulfativibrio zosterae TaxID=2675053 RepID=A0A6F8PKG6_9GAMM|nr:EAL domain-containing protein [Thiosulfativibrio zosterae]BBP42490.1 hypothetical protein THMIRHAT_02360 [Thiosulfativibrio zosterae]